MKKLMIALLMIISTSSWSQCIYEKNKEDKFTGKREVIAKFKLSKRMYVHHSETIRPAIMNIGGNYYLRLEYMHAVRWSVSHDGKSIMVLSSGDKLELNVKDYVVSRTNGGYSNHYEYIYFPVDQNQVELLSNHRLTDLRIYFSDGYKDFEIKEKNQSMIKELMKCAS